MCLMSDSRSLNQPAYIMLNHISSLPGTSLAMALSSRGDEKLMKEEGVRLSAQERTLQTSWQLGYSFINFVPTHGLTSSWS